MVTGHTRFGHRVSRIAANRVARACERWRLLRGTPAQHVLLSRDGAARRASAGWNRIGLVSRGPASPARLAVARSEEFNVAQRRRALLAHDGRHLGLVIFVVAD